MHAHFFSTGPSLLVLPCLFRMWLSFKSFRSWGFMLFLGSGRSFCLRQLGTSLAKLTSPVSIIRVTEMVLCSDWFGFCEFDQIDSVSRYHDSWFRAYYQKHIHGANFLAKFHVYQKKWQVNTFLRQLMQKCNPRLMINHCLLCIVYVTTLSDQGGE